MPASLHARVLLATTAISVAAIVAVSLLSAQAAQRSVDRRFDADARDAQAIAGIVLATAGTADAHRLLPGVPLEGSAAAGQAHDATATSALVGPAPVLSGTITATELRDRFAQPAAPIAADVVIYDVVPGSTVTVTESAATGPFASTGPWELAVDDRGAVYIGLDDRLAASLTDDGSTLLSEVNRNLLITAAATIGMTAGAGYAASRTVTRPLQALTGAARELGHGARGRRVATNGRGEVGELAEAFNAMADGIERQETLRQALISDVAHELRTPIHNMVGQLDAVADGLLEPDPTTLGSMRDDALLLGRLVTDLNDLAQAEAGQLPLHPARVDLVALLDGVVRSSRRRAEAAGVSLTLEASAAAVELTADRERLAQVAHNLVDNAITNTPRGGAVTVLVPTDPEHVTFEVRDTGRGIAPEHLPHIFDRFYRADPSRSRATGGAGLGLAIVQRLVRAHRGTVEVESVLDEGSRFTVRLPRD